MQYSRGLSSPAIWRAAMRQQPADISVRLGLAQALIAHSLEAEADGGDEEALLGECAMTLCTIDNLDELSPCDAYLFAATASRCAAGLIAVGRPRVALAVLAPAMHALDSRSVLASIVGCPCRYAAETAATHTKANGHAHRPGFIPVSVEDTAPGELFAMPWPLPPVSWHYLRASLGAATGHALSKTGDTARAVAELTDAALIALAGAPFDYTRTADLSVMIADRLALILEGDSPQVDVNQA
ncbi:hypothetical protein [Demequina capsici]|uniref:Uncharacterized protein n=1 Tax=Demequina capsici TaxID=3075620 RepID=A0AA96F895_9MICO|nr:hypothetical protein [Demequina sp. OYTSA14]WNM23510.1 hypothetical protein RN606_09025 [Demequina sp. OYTSA14]